MPVPSPPAPTTLPSAPSFTLDKLLGSGHYGRVYRYEDQSTGEERAVKSVASSSGLADPQREAMALARVQEWAHPNVVRFFGHERITGGSLLVFECLHGGELFDHVIDMLSSGAPVPTERARFLFRQIVRGVAHLHALGIAHLDVKLENCMLGRDMETVTIVDLGLWHDLKEGFVTHTPYRGSPAYMSPEVFANMACGDRQPARLPYDGAPADVWVSEVGDSRACHAPSLSEAGLRCASKLSPLLPPGSSRALGSRSASASSSWSWASILSKSGRRRSYTST